MLTISRSSKKRWLKDGAYTKVRDILLLVRFGSSFAKWKSWRLKLTGRKIPRETVEMTAGGSQKTLHFETTDYPFNNFKY